MADDVGMCPNCGGQVDMDAPCCPSCKARFGADSSWKVLQPTARQAVLPTRASPQWVRWVVAVPVVIVGIAVADWLFQSYSDMKGRELLLKTKGPLVDVLILATIESEVKFPRRPKTENDPPRPACSLSTTCGGEVKSYKIESDGTVRLVLSGNLHPDLKDKSIVLAPSGVSNWHCTTNVPLHFLPTPQERPSFGPRWAFLGSMGDCIADQAPR